MYYYSIVFQKKNAPEATVVCMTHRYMSILLLSQIPIQLWYGQPSWSTVRFCPQRYRVRFLLVKITRQKSNFVPHMVPQTDSSGKLSVVPIKSQMRSSGPVSKKTSVFLPLFEFSCWPMWAMVWIAMWVLLVTFRKVDEDYPLVRVELLAQSGAPRNIQKGGCGSPPSRSQ